MLLPPHIMWTLVYIIASVLHNTFHLFVISFSRSTCKHGLLILIYQRIIPNPSALWLFINSQSYKADFKSGSLSSHYPSLNIYPTLT